MAASGNAAAQPQGGLSAFLLPLAFVAIFYFMLWRPQSKRAKAQQDMVSGIQKGDEIVTSGGLLGKVVEVSEKFLSVTISEDTIVKLQKNAVSAVLPKGTIKSS
jgi:preprotein translocase subunit YajC